LSWKARRFEVFGPNGAQVVRFLEEVDSIGDVALMQYESGPGFVRAAQLIPEVMYRGGLDQENGLSISAFASGWTARNSFQRSISFSWLDPAWPNHRVAEDLFTLGTALVVRHLLPAAKFEAIYAPWERVLDASPLAQKAAA
jgi:hypothetical protein